MAQSKLSDEEKAKLVHEVTINFKDKTKIMFFGLITDLRYENNKVVHLSWKNVKHTEQRALRSTRMRFVDLTSIRSIVERCIDATGQYEFGDEYTVTDASSK